MCSLLEAAPSKPRTWAPLQQRLQNLELRLPSRQIIVFMGFSRQESWSGLPFPSPVDHILSDLSTIPIHLGWPHTAWLSFIELDKAVVLVWLDWLVFCDYGFSVSALWCPLATPTIFWVSLTLGVGYLFTAAPAKHSCCSLPWMRGISFIVVHNSLL